MKLDDVMDELATRLGRIPNLRTFAYPPDNAHPPAAIVSYPTTYTYDETYGRGSDRLELPVVLVVGKPTDRSSRDALAVYVAGAGPFSVKAALEAGDAATFDRCRVMSVDFDVVSLAGDDVVAAMFALELVGEGTT